jgi:tRNA threonylcarbamoyladenosine biosynthesis protein TsaB
MGCGSSAPVAGDLESLSGSQRAAALVRPHTTLTPQASRKDGLLVTPSAAHLLRIAASAWSGAVPLDGWEPDYGRLAEAQVKWEASNGAPLPTHGMS